jgi:hypothetical protein
MKFHFHPTNETARLLGESATKLPPSRYLHAKGEAHLGIILAVIQGRPSCCYVPTQRPGVMTSRAGQVTDGREGGAAIQREKLPGIWWVVSSIRGIHIHVHHKHFQICGSSEQQRNPLRWDVYRRVSGPRSKPNKQADCMLLTVRPYKIEAVRATETSTNLFRLTA